MEPRIITGGTGTMELMDSKGKKQDIPEDKLPDMPYDFDTLQETKHLRRSVYDLQVITLDDEYPEGKMPEELKPFHFYFASGPEIVPWKR